MRSVRALEVHFSFSVLGMVVYAHGWSDIILFMDWVQISGKLALKKRGIYRNLGNFRC